MAHHLRASFLPQTKRVPIHPRFALSHITSGCLFLLYAVALAAFVICSSASFPSTSCSRRRCRRTMGKADHHGFKLFLLLSTIAVIPMIVLANYARTESTRRMTKDLFGLLRFHDSVNHAGAHQHLSGPVVGSGRDGRETRMRGRCISAPDAGRDHARSFTPISSRRLDLPLTPESLYGKLLLFA